MSAQPYFKLKNNNSKSIFSKIFSFKSTTVKPITKEQIQKKDYSKEYYNKFGIIYTGSDLGSCINSLF